MDGWWEPSTAGPSRVRLARCRPCAGCKSDTTLYGVLYVHVPTYSVEYQRRAMRVKYLEQLMISRVHIYGVFRRSLTGSYHPSLSSMPEPDVPYSKVRYLTLPYSTAAAGRSRVCVSTLPAGEAWVQPLVPVFWGVYGCPQPPLCSSGHTPHVGVTVLTRVQCRPSSPPPATIGAAASPPITDVTDLNVHSQPIPGAGQGTATLGALMSIRLCY